MATGLHRTDNCAEYSHAQKGCQTSNTFYHFLSVLLPFVELYCTSITTSMSSFVSTERLYNSNGRDLRRALFSLKQIFQVTNTHTHRHMHISYAITISLLLLARVWLLWLWCASMMTDGDRHQRGISLCVYTVSV